MVKLKCCVFLPYVHKFNRRHHEVIGVLLYKYDHIQPPDEATFLHVAFNS